MITAYILVLCVSAWLAAYVPLRIGGRVASMLGNPALMSAGLVLTLVVVGFLTVVAAAPGVLVGALMVLIAQLLARGGYLPPVAQWGVPLVAAMLAAAGLALPAIATLPALVSQLIATVVLFGMVLAARALPTRPAPAGIGFLACMAPLIVASLLGAPSFLALDVMIVASTMLGITMAANPSSNLALARPPLSLILGWLILQAIVHGAWIAGLASALAYGAFIAYARTQEKPSTPLTHAP